MAVARLAHERHPLLCGKDYIVGRKDCDILIANDQSISRKHALLQASHSETDLGRPHILPRLSLTDTSKLGTVVGLNRIVSRRCDIQDGDCLLFGSVGGGKYRAVFEPFIITASCLDAAAKSNTKQLVTRLGGHLVADWRKECELLVMSSLSVTIKVISALVCLKPIVTPAYLDRLIASQSGDGARPNPDRFAPPLAESQINPTEVSFKVDVRRKTLFEGKIFIFLSPRQFKKLSLCVELSGGTPMLMEEGTDDNEDDIIVAEMTCVMHFDPADTSQAMSQNARDWLHHVTEILRKHNKRAISDSEIGYAVLYCSTAHYCNANEEPVSSSVGLPRQSVSQHPMSPSQSVPQPASPPSAFRRPMPRPARTFVPDSLSHRHTELSESESAFVAETESLVACSPPQIKNELCSDSEATPRHDLPPVDNARNMPTSCPTKRLHDEEAVSTRTSASLATDVRDGPVTVEMSAVKREETVAAKTSPAVMSPRPKRARVTGPSSAVPQQPKTEPVEVADGGDDGSDVPCAQEVMTPMRGAAAVATLFSRLHDESPAEPTEDVTRAGGQRRGDERVVRSDDHVKVNDLVKVDAGMVAEEADEEKPRELLPQKQEAATFHESHSETVVNGFLNTRNSIAVRQSDHIKEEDLPSNLVVVVEASLLVDRRTKPTAPTELPTMWKGKRVKNFKKFKKMFHADALPRIIGRSDMEVYDNSDRHELNEFFNEQIMIESQRNEVEKMAQEMFEWEPSAGSIRKRART